MVGTRWAAIALAVALAGCSKDSGPAGSGGAGGAGGAQGGGAGGAGGAAAPVETAFVTTVAAIRKQPSDAKQVDDPSGKKVNNWVATLSRGEKVTLLKTQEDWVMVRASDESEGWLKKNTLLPASGASEAAVLVESDTFDRPDITTIKGGSKLAAGTLVFITKSKDAFREVNTGAWAPVWVPADKLTEDAKEVTVAKLIAKARYLTKEKGGAGVDALVAVAKSQLGDAKLLPILTGDAAGAGEVKTGTSAAAAP